MNWLKKLFFSPKVKSTAPLTQKEWIGAPLIGAIVTSVAFDPVWCMTTPFKTEYVNKTIEDVSFDCVKMEGVWYKIGNDVHELIIKRVILRDCV